MKQILIAALLILLMSCTATAAYTVETNIPYEGTRNLPPDDSYAFFDFEMNEGEWRSNLCAMPKSQLNGAVLFEDYTAMYYANGNWTEVHNFWGYSSNTGRGMHVYPYDYFWDRQNDTNVPWIHLIEGGWNACPVISSWQPYPGTDGVISFPDGADEVSFLVSTGDKLRVKVYDKRDNLIEYVTVPRTVDRVTLPDGPSTWALVTIKVSGISWIHFRGPYNGWGLDDLCIGGLTLPEEPTDYSWAAERLKHFVGLNHLPYGTAWDYAIGDYRTAEEMMDDKPDPYLDFDTGELEFGIGINDQDAILVAFNGEGENLVNWWDTNRMIKHDFTEVVEYVDIKPGDVFFIDYPQEFADGGFGPDGCYDEVGMVIEPMLDDSTMVDIIRITPVDGVHYSTTEFINANYGNSGFVDYRRLPDNPKGGHSPYKKAPAGKLI